MADIPYVRNPTYTDFKESVRLASTANVDISNPPTELDGVALVYGDSILLKDQADGTENGIWKWGPAGAPLNRAPGAIDAQISSGMLVIVEEGDVNADKIFMLTTDEPIEVDETELVFEEFAPATDLSAYATIAYVDASAVSTLSELTDADTTGSFDGAVLAQHFGGVFSPVANFYAEDDAITVYGNVLRVDNNGSVEIVNVATAGTIPMTIWVTGDDEPRLSVQGDGTLLWGDGTNPADVVLSRTGINTLGLAAGDQFSVQQDPTADNHLARKAYVDSVAGGGAGEIIVQRYQYDFADLGGAVGPIILTDDQDNPQQLPANSFFHYSYLEPITPLTSGGAATVKIGWAADDDAVIPGTVAFDSIFFNATYVGSTIRTAPDAGGGNIRAILTSANNLILTVAGAPLTGGKFNVYVASYLTA